MRFMVDRKNPDPFKGTHFKFLGRWIHPSLSEKEVKKRTRLKFEKEIALVDEAKINGFMKLWLYQFYLLPHLLAVYGAGFQ